MLSTHEMTMALRTVIRPYSAGTAYGQGYVNASDGNRIVSCLAIRARDRANAVDVAHELNQAHYRSARRWVAGLTAAAVAERVLREVAPDAPALDVAAVFVCDALKISTSAPGAEVLARLFYGLRPDLEPDTVDAVVQAVAVAAALEAVGS